MILRWVITFHQPGVVYLFFITEKSSLMLALIRLIIRYIISLRYGSLKERVKYNPGLCVGHVSYYRKKFPSRIDPLGMFLLHINHELRNYLSESKTVFEFIYCGEQTYRFKRKC